MNGDYKWRHKFVRKYRLNDDAVFDPDRHKMTPKEEKKFNADFDTDFAAFCKTMERRGYASMSDPYGSKQTRPLSERLRDGSTIITDYEDGTGTMPFPEFMRRALNGEFDE